MRSRISSLHSHPNSCLSGSTLDAEESSYLTKERRLAVIEAGNKILANKSELLAIHVDNILIASQHAKPIDKDNILYGSCHLTI